MMQVSIWHQWASNHSGIFWVVGTFDTVELAQHAYTEIRNMLFTIDQWHRDHKEESTTAMRSGNIEPLPPEQEFAQKYNVLWPRTIDWDNWANYYLKDYPGFANYDPQQQARNLIIKSVSIVGRNVIVSNPDQTWMTTQPFESILTHFGAETIGYDFEFIESEAGRGFGFSTRLVFTAPDAVTADRIEIEFRRYFDGDFVSKDSLPPWNNDAENFESVLPESKLLKREHIDNLLAQWQLRYELHSRPTPSPTGKAMPSQRLALSRKPRQMNRENLHFTLEDLWFYNQELGVSALIAWLEVNNCTDIDYRYVLQLDKDTSNS
jgi:hypothetical protein